MAEEDYSKYSNEELMKMLENAVILENEGLLDLEALERYILEELGGVVDQRYADVYSNITFTEGELGTSEGENGSNEGKPGINNSETDVAEDSNSTTLIICISLGSVILLAAAVSVAILYFSACSLFLSSVML